MTCKRFVKSGAYLIFMGLGERKICPYFRLFLLTYAGAYTVESRVLINRNFNDLKKQMSYDYFYYSENMLLIF